MITVSYTHLDVYKRQNYNCVKKVNKHLPKYLDYYISFMKCYKSLTK